MAFSVAISRAVHNFLDSDNWKYDPITEGGTIRTGVALDNKLKGADVYIMILSNGFVVNSMLSIEAGEQELFEVLKFISLINDDNPYGSFGVDLSDGTVICRTELFCGSTVPTREQIEFTLYNNIDMLDSYGDALAKVLFGVMTAEDAYEEAEAAQ